MGVPSGLIFYFFTLGLQGALYIQTVSGPGPGPLLFQLCPVPHWATTAARLRPGHTERPEPHLAEDLTGWLLGSDVPGSQESHFSKGCPLPMPGSDNSANNLSLKTVLGM